MVLTKAHGVDNTHANDLDSWYRIGTPESHMYERAECYPFAGFFFNNYLWVISLSYSSVLGRKKSHPQGSHKKNVFLLDIVQKWH